MGERRHALVLEQHPHQHQQPWTTWTLWTPASFTQYEQQLTQQNGEPWAA